MTEATLNNDIDSLLDSKLDDLADMPEFKPFPAGAHKVIINWDYSKLKEEKFISIKLTAVETLELVETDPPAEPLKQDDNTTVRMYIRTKDGKVNEFGEGQWKNLLTPLAAHFGTGSNRETMDASNGAECVVVTKLKKNDSDKNDIKYNTVITQLAVV